jgi:AcrR family transcriptional regulator
MPPKVKDAPAKEKPVEVNHRTIVGRNRRKKTEARIIVAALRVFADKGPDAPVIDDFIKAAGIARGTFYNYFNNTAELLEATSTWLADDLIESIEGEIIAIKDPVLRHGLGLRLWLRKAKADDSWCRFVANVWFKGGFALEAPIRDIRLSLKTGGMSCASAECGWDVALGALRQAMIRLLLEPNTKKSYLDNVVDTVLQGLGVNEEKRRQILTYPLPEIRRPTKTVT